MFANRQDAGRRLVLPVQHLAEQQPVVLGLPRGGVPVAAVVAEALRAPLDVLVVRKIGAPLQPELAIGAVTDGNQPSYVLNDEVVRKLRIEQDYLEPAIDRELKEVERRQSLYRSGRDARDIRGATAIVVDDGIATGATVRAGLQALRSRDPKRLVLAIPVGPPESVEQLRSDVDELICLETPSDFYAVGQFYRDFDQTSDDEVIRLLDDAARRCN